MFLFDICYKEVVLKTNCVSEFPTKHLKKIQMLCPHPRCTESECFPCDGKLGTNSVWYVGQELYNPGQHACL